MLVTFSNAGVWLAGSADKVGGSFWGARAGRESGRAVVRWHTAARGRGVDWAEVQKAGA